MKRPDLAWTFREIARNGEDAFYKGSIAKKIAQSYAAKWWLYYKKKI